MPIDHKDIAGLLCPTWLRPQWFLLAGKRMAQQNHLGWLAVVQTSAPAQGNGVCEVWGVFG
jgi:hypothetical protein